MAQRPKKSAGGSNLRQKRINPFEIDFASDVDDRQYRGKFVSKKLGIRDIAALGVRKAQLNGGMHHDPMSPGHGVDSDTDEFNNMIATLEVAIIEAPEWWNLDEISDVSLVATVFQEVMIFENTFLGRRGRAGDSGDGDDGGGEAGGSSDPSGSLDAGDVAEVVDEEVQSALEP